MRISDIQRDWPVFAREGTVAIGAVRDVSAGKIVIYVEAMGDVTLTQDQIGSVHDGKVILQPDRLSDEVQTAIARAHDREDNLPHPAID